MNTASIKHLAIGIPIFLGLAASSLHATQVILDTTFGEGAGNVLDKSAGPAKRDDALWRSDNGDWNHGVGNTWIFNTSTGNNNVAEGGLVRTIALGGLGLTDENALSVTFTYADWGVNPAADNLHIHLWGLVDVSSSPTSGTAELWSSAGNLWGGQTDYADFTRYNLRDGTLMALYSDSNSSTAAHIINRMKLSDTNDGTRDTVNFVLNSTGTIANYDYLVVGLARNTAGNSGEGFAIHDINITAIPEPSSLALFALAGSILFASLRRRIH